MSDLQKNLDDYCREFEQLSPETLDNLQALVSANVHFRDPFNDVTGWSGMRRVMVDMFEHCDAPRFTVTEQVLDGDRAYLRWGFETRVPVLGRLKVDGLSRLAFDEAGLICEHLDFWDASPIYLRLPLIGWLLRKVRKRLSAG